ncbi:MAG: hypothetical protein A3C53_07020 [Omnitrophica WOR_2 bacterium RIFCSPHIGHO2_02_FULL_68_15]|nr:MAG: hypothetical protein A3C53_07020 [Omnitrophica WOR_2 bacterium RIFCSPHIGHO2_02_FULL_68_15]
MKIAIVASEGVPFSKTGGLADVVGALPLALERLGHEVVVILPKYKGITRRRATVGQGIPVLFVEHDGYFGREHLYGGKDGDYPDNLERFSFFAWRALETLKELNFRPDAIHVHDWQAALIPVYLATTYRDDPVVGQATTLLTVHNLAYQGVFPKSEFSKLGLPWELFHMEGLEYYDQVNLLKGGLLFAKRLNTVSPTYAREIQTPEYGCGLDGVLRKRRADLAGVLNGIDTTLWDPATDKALAAPFSAAKPDGKAADKRALQAALGLPTDPAAPLIGMITRLAAQKGLDLVAAAMEDFVALGVQVAVLGTGDRVFHEQFEALGRRFPNTLAVRLSFDDRLARQIYAGSDLFLMPSRFEPCGLGQMIAMRYGAIPVVRKTGGLADTVVEASADGSKGNGVVFEAAEASELAAAVRRALALYRRRAAWTALQRRAMQTDWSWERAARCYVELYSGAAVPA